MNIRILHAGLRAQAREGFQIPWFIASFCVCDLLLAVFWFAVRAIPVAGSLVPIVFLIFWLKDHFFGVRSEVSSDLHSSARPLEGYLSLGHSGSAPLSKLASPGCGSLRRIVVVAVIMIRFGIDDDPEYDSYCSSFGYCYDCYCSYENSVIIEFAVSTSGLNFRIGHAKGYHDRRSWNSRGFSLGCC